MQPGKIENHETSKEIPLFKSIMVSDFILFEGTDQNLLVVINESCWAPINGSIHGVTGAFFPMELWAPTYHWFSGPTFRLLLLECGCW